jgi:hypothetical protein
VGPSGLPPSAIISGKGTRYLQRIVFLKQEAFNSRELSMTKTKLLFAVILLLGGGTQVLAGSGQNGPIGPGSRYGLEPGPTDGVASAPTGSQPSMAKARVNKEKRKAMPARG